MTIEEIRGRLHVIPQGDWHAVVGSGFNAMTGIACDDLADPEKTIFIADLIPDWIERDPERAEVAYNYRIALLNFITHAPNDLRELIDLVETQQHLIDALSATLRHVTEGAA